MNVIDSGRAPRGSALSGRTPPESLFVANTLSSASLRPARPACGRRTQAVCETAFQAKSLVVLRIGAALAVGEASVVIQSFFRAAGFVRRENCLHLGKM